MIEPSLPKESAAWLYDQYPFDRFTRQRSFRDVFQDLNFLQTLDWIDHVPPTVFECFESFILVKHAESPQPEFQVLLFDESKPLAERIRDFCKLVAPDLSTQEFPAPIQPPLTKRLRLESFEIPRFSPPPWHVKPPFIKTLHVYLQPSIPSALKPWLWFSNEHFVVVYDAYPKARFHVLLMPKSESISSNQEVHELVSQCVAKMGVDHDQIRVGLHAIPSMIPLRKVFDPQHGQYSPFVNHRCSSHLRRL